MTMERTLPADWRRDDAPGAELTNSTLKQRCAARSLSVLGGRSEMIKRLDHHQEVCSEKRLISWQNQPSYPVFGHPYEYTLQLADRMKLRIVHAKDGINQHEGYLTKQFRVTHAGGELFIIRFSRELRCSCNGWTYNPHCVHIVYILRCVLNCPEPLRWQRSFLSTELEDIYRHSYAVSTLLLTKWKGQNTLCALCFKACFPTEGYSTCCVTCGRTMHTECVGVAQKARALTKEEQCWRCKDEVEWGIDKYCEPGQVQYPLIVPGTKGAPQKQPGPDGDTAQQPNECTESGAVTTKDLSSSHGEHSGKPSGQQANHIPSISTDPVPSTATAPASAATPDTALAPTSGTGSVENPASTTTHANISDRDSAKLVQDRNLMAKELAEMRKRAKREHQKLNKKHKKEIKRHLRELKKHKKDHAKLEKKSKRELERLMKKSKNLEKKAKGLGAGREGNDDA